MVETAVTQDILKYKPKFVGNFSAREAFFLGLGAISGLISFFVLFPSLSLYPRIYVSVFFIVPFLLFGFLSPLNRPLEEVLQQVIFDNFICPKDRINEIKHPAYEEFLRNGYKSNEEIIVDSENNESEANETSKKKQKQKKKIENTPKKEKKIQKSKEYKSIR